MRLNRFVAPLAAAMCALVACAPWFSSQFPTAANGAAAQAPSSPEQLARYSVPAAQTAENVAGVGQFFPPAALPSTVVANFMAAYTEEIKRQITALDSRIAQNQPVSPTDWWRAIGFAALAGVSHIFSWRHGFSSASGKATA